MRLAGLFALLQMHAAQPAARPAFYEYLIVGGAAVATAWAFWAAIKATVHPGENEPDHIKRLVLEDEDKKPHE